MPHLWQKKKKTENARLLRSSEPIDAQMTPSPRKLRCLHQTSMLTLAKRYCREAGFRSSSTPLCSLGCSARVARSPAALTKPRASPQPADREKSPWVTQPRVTREQWEVTLGSGSGHSPRVQSEAGSGSSDVPASDGSVLDGRAEVLAAFFFFFFFLNSWILLFTWSLWVGSWGPLLPGPLLSRCRSSGVGTHTMAWTSGLPLQSKDRRTHTRLIWCAARKRATAEGSRGGASATRHALWPLDDAGLHQPESSFSDFLFLGSIKTKCEWYLWWEQSREGEDPLSSDYSELWWWLYEERCSSSPSLICDVLLQFEAGCNLGILIREVMMKGGEMGEAPSIRPVRSWMAAAPRLPKDLKKSSTLLTLWRRAWGGG